MIYCYEKVQLNFTNAGPVTVKIKTVFDFNSVYLLDYSRNTV